MHHFLKRKNSLIFLWKAQKVSDFYLKEQITHFIEQELTPFFTKNFSAEKKKELEELLDEVISKNISLEAHFNSFLYPFNFSSNEKFFFKELKALLYKKPL